VAEPATAIPLQAPIAYLRSEAALSHCSSAEPPVDARLDVEPSTKVPSESSSISPSEQQALEATVRLKIVDEQGHSYGTGTIIDVHEDEALVLTCGHIFRDSRGKGDIICDLFVNGDATGIPGKLIGYNLRRDVGLVSIRPGIRVSPVQVGGSGRQPKDGDAVFAVGCDHGKDPTILRNSIRAVNRYHGPANLVVGGRPVDGRSGGGLFTREGILIGVCNAADQEANEGLYAALGPIHAELDQAGLGFIYRNEEAAVAAAPDKQSSIRPRVEAIASRVLPPRRLLPSPMTSSGRSETSADPTAEVIVITRDPQNPNQPGQVYVLDRPSQGLLQTLANELSRRGPHVATAGRGQTSTSLNSFELPSGPEGGNWHSGP
jgi:S1-C subfamily serine protease